MIKVTQLNTNKTLLIVLAFMALIISGCITSTEPPVYSHESREENPTDSLSTLDSSQVADSIPRKEIINIKDSLAAKDSLDLVQKEDTNQVPDTDPIEGKLDHSDIIKKEDGSVVINTPDNELVLEKSDLDIAYNEDGTIQSIEGTATIPSPTNYINIENPLEAAVGYFKGDYLNTEWEVSIPLNPNRYYMAFKLALNTEVKMGFNNNNEDTKPISLKPPLGGHIIEIIDLEEPFFFFSASQDLIGELCFGGSVNPVIPFEPLQPHEKFQSFNGTSFRCGSFPLFNGVTVKGSIIQNQGFSAELTSENPLPLSFDVNYYAGINGEFDLGLPIKGWLEFGIPLGEASAGLTVDVGTSGAYMQMFLNGLAKPDNSWWPEFVPVKPAAQMRLKGYLDETGDFDLSLEGKMELELPNRSTSIEAIGKLTPESFTISSSVESEGLRYTLGAVLEARQADVYTEFPEEGGIVNNMTDLLEEHIKQTATKSVDSSLMEISEAKKNLETSLANYEFERSLRGLRSTLPPLVDNSIKFIDSKVSSTIASARKSAKNSISSPAKYCSDNISSKVAEIVNPYKNALRNLKSATLLEDNEMARVQLEAALRKLASMNKINTSKKFTVKVGSTITGCGITSSQSRTVKVSLTVISEDNVNDLLLAADNMKSIPETSNDVIKAQDLLDKLPSEEDLQKLRNGILNEVEMDFKVSRVGFIKNNRDLALHFYIVINKEVHQIENLDIFDLGSIAKAAVNFLDSK